MGDQAPALVDVDLTVGTAERLALIGPSGAGKSTLLRIMGATQRLTAGRAVVAGEELAHLSGTAVRALRARIGFVHQDHALVPNLRVSQNVAAGRLGLRGRFAGIRSMLFPSSADLERIHEILDQLGIASKLFARTNALSGGEAQRVAVARALFQEPDALIADEPVASVDPARAEDLIKRLLRIAGERSCPLVVSLHDVDLARAHFPRIIGLRAGRIVFDGTPDELGGPAIRELYRLDEGHA